MPLAVIHPDSRGRLALREFLQPDHLGYSVSVDDHGTITAVPIVATLTAEQRDDFYADPVGFRDLMMAAAESNPESISIDEFFAD